MPTFQLFLDPASAPRQVRSHLWNPSSGVVNYRKLKDEIRRQANAGNLWILPDSLDLTFFLPMPKSWSLKERQACNFQPHQQKPDIDNLLKAFMDAFGEDKHVHTVAARKVWAESGRIQVVIT